ncbi:MULTISPECIES: phage antirepressor KilAC domain-containing protein [unclassified Aeromonas]|uniref:phage antirepressor KilAC domain-containing protein n=1 Tax=unclassified Aeromonas TaxID=257493 RepID=UPI0022E90028|nr:MULTISPECIES: phage antirepressor KilAC domain-containing protein [unclassified Aeromonas]
MTNLSIITSTEMTMGTREIAELLGKQHSNIKISAQRLAVSGVIGTLATQEFSHNGNVYEEYRLNKRDSLILVAQNCPEFTAQIVDRWQELESQQRPQIPQTYAAALLEAGRLALEVEEKTKQLEYANNVISINAPKADFFDHYAYCGGSLGFREVAKLLKAKEHEFRAFLCAKRYMYQLSGQWMAYAQHLDAGRFEVKTGTAERNNYAFAKTVFTPKGVQWIAGEWGKYQAEKALAS